MRIPFHIPTVTGHEQQNLARLLANPALAGSDGEFTKQCAAMLRERLGLGTVLFTPSCTAALEMAAILTTRPGDEVIVPSFTFVTSVSSFTRIGVRPVFCDVREDTLNLDESLLEGLITERTRAIVAVHYGGVACNMDEICRIAAKHSLRVVEDSAQGLTGTFRGQSLGTFGDLACLSFHSTKNYHCGEGGALIVNDESLLDRAEIIREKGTNRRAFMRGQADKYTWVDEGSSYVPSELAMSFLAGQLLELESIRSRRRRLHELYVEQLQSLHESGMLHLPKIHEESGSSYHLTYLLLPDEDRRNSLLSFLSENGVGATFHYVPLHTSPVGSRLHDGRPLPVTESVASRLLRLPLYPDLTEEQVLFACASVRSFLEGSNG